jgi:hypothetical protein
MIGKDEGASRNRRLQFQDFPLGRTGIEFNSSTQFWHYFSAVRMLVLATCDGQFETICIKMTSI